MGRLRVGISHTEISQNANLEAFHAARRRRRLMIMAEQVENAMNDEMAQVVGETFTVAIGISACHAVGNDDVPKHIRAAGQGAGAKVGARAKVEAGAGEREDVGRLVPLAEITIELPHRRVIGEDDAGFH